MGEKVLGLIESVDFHAAVAIVQGSDSKELLMSVYDERYFLKDYRGSANLIGGNPKQGQISPRQTLEDEINEEFMISDDAPALNYIENFTWASEKDIFFVRDDILKNLEIVGDYFATTHYLDRPDRSGKQVMSIFKSVIPETTLDIARKNIDEGLNLVSEGFLGVFSLEQLVNGNKFLAAHNTGPILNDVFGTNIQYPEGFGAKKISDTVRDSYEDYANEYHKNWLTH